MKKLISELVTNHIDGKSKVAVYDGSTGWLEEKKGMLIALEFLKYIKLGGYQNGPNHIQFRECDITPTQLGQLQALLA